MEGCFYAKEAGLQLLIDLGLGMVTGDTVGSAKGKVVAVAVVAVVVIEGASGKSNVLPDWEIQTAHAFPEPELNYS